MTKTRESQQRRSLVRSNQAERIPVQKDIKVENAALYPNRPFPGIDIVSIYLFLTVIAFSMAVQVMKRWRLTEQRAVLAEADKANAELSFLKAQINPHFLFNTLNNIYTLAITKNKHTAESIMKLSNIMRYITDDAGKDFVPFENEIDFITDYVDLHRLRLGKNALVTYLVSGNLNNLVIAPLILISFIENVFQHGISKHAYSPLIIKIHADQDTITFYSENKTFEKNKKMERTSIGVANTVQRLNYLYRNKHSLDINSNNGRYTVSLSLQL